MRSPPDDADEFQRALAGVEPLAKPRRLPLARARPAPVARQRQRDEHAAHAESLRGPLSVDDALESGEELVFLRAGLSRQLLRELRRERWGVEDGLDLHGMNRTQAPEAVAVLPRRCIKRGLVCVRI